MAEETLQVNLKWKLERLYVRKANLQLFDTPTLFEKTWQPNVDLKFHSSTSEVGTRRFEVRLEIELSCINHEERAFELTIEQAALVAVVPNLSNEEVRHILSREVTNALFAYLRESTDTLAVKASLPPFALAHVDFGKLVEEGFDRIEKQRSAKKAASDNNELLN